jgi:hypothetical protein
MHTSVRNSCFFRAGVATGSSQVLWAQTRLSTRCHLHPRPTQANAYETVVARNGDVVGVDGFVVVQLATSSGFKFSIGRVLEIIGLPHSVVAEHILVERFDQGSMVQPYDMPSLRTSGDSVATSPEVGAITTVPPRNNLFD